ncbi:MAG: SDR family NAD(P)-dependent oxidoreductase, partial [Gemmatimonadaceae bacterium]
MDLQLRGKVALVAASSRGLGRAIAESLAAEGADLVLAARDAAAIAEVARELASQHGVRAVGVRADVAVAADVEALVATALREFGRVDILVTNAGGPPAGTFESLPADAWPKAVALTLESVGGRCRGG